MNQQEFDGFAEGRCHQCKRWHLLDEKGFCHSSCEERHIKSQRAEAAKRSRSCRRKLAAQLRGGHDVATVPFEYLRWNAEGKYFERLSDWRLPGEKISWLEVLNLIRQTWRIS